MSNYTTSLLPNENFKYCTKKHAIIFSAPILFSIIVSLLQIFSSMAVNSHYLAFPTIFSYDFRILPILVVGYSWMMQILSYTTSRYMITNKRVILREGFFWLKVTEINVLNISEINIEQNILGRIINYGSVKINSFGSNSAEIQNIAGPEQFKRKILEMQSQ